MLGLKSHRFLEHFREPALDWLLLLRELTRTNIGAKKCREKTPHDNSISKFVCTRAERAGTQCGCGTTGLVRFLFAGRAHEPIPEGSHGHAVVRREGAGRRRHSICSGGYFRDL